MNFRAVLLQQSSYARQQRGNLVVLNTAQAPVLQPSDIFVGQDTIGWPPAAIPNVYFAQKITGLVVSSFTPPPVGGGTLPHDVGFIVNVGFLMLRR